MGDSALQEKPSWCYDRNSAMTYRIKTPDWIKGVQITGITLIPLRETATGAFNSKAEVHCGEYRVVCPIEYVKEGKIEPMELTREELETAKAHAQADLVNVEAKDEKAALEALIAAIDAVLPFR